MLQQMQCCISVNEGTVNATESSAAEDGGAIYDLKKSSRHNQKIRGR